MVKNTALGTCRPRSLWIVVPQSLVYFLNIPLKKRIIQKYFKLCIKNRWLNKNEHFKEQTFIITVMFSEQYYNSLQTKKMCTRKLQECIVKKIRSIRQKSAYKKYKNKKGRHLKVFFKRGSNKYIYTYFVSIKF